MTASPTAKRPFFATLSFQALTALALGLGAGALAGRTGLPGGEGTAGLIAGVGALWLNALKMTIVPLVFSLLVTGVASIADAARTGRMAAKAILIFGVLITFAACYGMAAAFGLNALWPIDPAGGQALLAGAPPPDPALSASPAVADFLRTLAPANPVRAAAEDAILGLVVFAIVFGFAATRLPDRLRLPLVTVFEAIAETMIVIVRWVLLAAPVGVFALAMGVGLSAGLGAAGTLAHYIALLVLAQLGIILLCYPLAAMFGRISLARFARGAAPAQVVAVSTQSSLASLPVMVERAVDFLGVARPTAGFVLPLAVAVFRITSPIANLGVAVYCAHLFGVELSAGQIAAGVFVAILVSIGSVGLPGQISFFASIAPICIAMGVPLDLLPLLLAVEIAPDIFRTVGNVTADLAVVRIVQGRDVTEESENRETPPA